MTKETIEVGPQLEVRELFAEVLRDFMQREQEKGSDVKDVLMPTAITLIALAAGMLIAVSDGEAMPAVRSLLQSILEQAIEMELEEHETMKKRLDN